MSLWGGRFTKAMDEDAWRFNASITFDKRLAAQDVRASISWARQLLVVGVLSEKEFCGIEDGLNQIQDEFLHADFLFSSGDEDIHSAVERRLYELIGLTAGKIHTGRSRNDQVTTDFRLWIMDNIPILKSHITSFQMAIINVAERDLGIVMPSYTHLQRAQPILLSHWWLAWFWPLERDLKRLDFTLDMCATLPLGSGAVAGTGFNINRQALAKDLGFQNVGQNSIDSVSDRDFAVQFLFDLVLCCQHISRLAEQTILFSTAEFGFFMLADAFSTGSSLMPQKKNADVFELARAKSGTMIGLLTGLLATLKSLPSTYDKDLQEDKQSVFQAFDILVNILTVLTKAIETLEINPVKMLAAVDPALFATDLADILVEVGVPFREAHRLAGKAVRHAYDHGSDLAHLSAREWQQLLPDLNVDVTQLFTTENSIARKKSLGGTARVRVQEQLDEAKRIILT